jgi:hypothetical protein
MPGQHLGLRKYWLSSHYTGTAEKMIVLISSNRYSMVGVGLEKLRKGGNELSKKTKY